MKNSFIIAMFFFWGFVVSVISAGYIVKQNRLSQEVLKSTVKDIVVSTSSVKTVVVRPKTERSSGLTLTEVSAHDTESDCWVVINGKVYSVASYIPMHPGRAQKIINVCGKEATIIFNGIKKNKGHSASANSLLGQYLVGTLQ